jgi:hypothetical protein
MAKYYIQSGSLQLIYSTNKDPINAAITALWETNEHDVLDEFFYVDERGMKNHMTALPDTTVIKSDKVFKKAGWEMG